MMARSRSPLHGRHVRRYIAGKAAGNDGSDRPGRRNPDMRRFGLAARFPDARPRGADGVSRLAAPGFGAGRGPRGVAAVCAGRLHGPQSRRRNSSIVIPAARMIPPIV